MKGQLHHIELYVSDLQKSMAFWGWLLGRMGYAVVNEWDQGISYQLGPTYIVLVQTETEHLSPPYHRKRTGLNHLAFHTDSREDVDELTEELRARNITILYEDAHPFAGGKHYYAVFFEDPDRMKVEVVAPE